MKTSLIALAGLVLTSVGCSAPASVVVGRNAQAPQMATHRGVDVYLDAAPERSFQVVSVLSANSLESTNSVEKMRDEAAKNGLDGIYWIECASPGSGHCSAKGFVYTSLAPSLNIADAVPSLQAPPAVVARTTAERRVASQD